MLLCNLSNIPFHTASSGEDAVQKGKSNEYDVILMDYFTQGITGIEAAKEIRKGKLNVNSNIVILTANEYTDKIRDANTRVPTKTDK
ncbi:unnamed protein product [Laminaria digitata]